ncbi:LL-diaminopimelate aminotransferase [Oscillospiraceae bacterium HV4-5-C5C]|nr:LL-diaminopimelate aminotransferase [Oscillospiraceae bacterium HV4-5-C5C]
MITLNPHFLELKPSYLFTDIARKVEAYQQNHPDRRVLKLGIGDVTLPLPQPVIEALNSAVAEMGTAEGFRGYGPEQGYAFLREKICASDYHQRGIYCIQPEDIFVSDGAKSDTGNFLDVLGQQLTVGVSDPVYPVYVDTNIMAGRAQQIVRLPATDANGYQPGPAELTQDLDLIYICSPNNPTGSVASRALLQQWVDYCRQHQALLIFDSAYEAFISDPGLPHSIYEIPGSETCAVEIRSYSKKAGFTGLRCGYTVVPAALMVAAEGQTETVSLRQLWNRRQTTKFNGVPYIVQRAAEAVYTPEGQQACAANIAYYKRNATLLKNGLSQMGYSVYGGSDAPYVWLKVPAGFSSWSFFDYLLEQQALVTTPGSGFGNYGEGYIRLSAFGSYEVTQEAVERLQQLPRPD